MLLDYFLWGSFMKKLVNHHLQRFTIIPYVGNILTHPLQVKLGSASICLSIFFLSCSAEHSIVIDQSCPQELSFYLSEYFSDHSSDWTLYVDVVRDEWDFMVPDGSGAYYSIDLKCKLKHLDQSQDFLISHNQYFSAEEVTSEILAKDIVYSRLSQKITALVYQAMSE